MEVNKKKTGGAATVILVLLFLAGLSLLLYPAVSNYWNTLHQANQIGNYDKHVQEMDNEKYKQMWSDARAYNFDLSMANNQYARSEENLEKYKELLNVSGTGIMGYVEIPRINCKLPIYHGTDEAVLQVAVGHLEWTSLPVGGKSTHSAISGHRGLPSAELLTHIDRLEEGDKFYIHILNEILEYRVCDIFVVLPEDSSELQIVEGKDYLTLVTCTPYGINSHRLLVRGERVEEGGKDTIELLYLNDEIREVHLMYVIPIVLVAVVAAVAAVSFLRMAREKGAAYQREKRRERRLRRRAERRGENEW